MTDAGPAQGPVLLILNPAARGARSAARAALIRALSRAGELEVLTTRRGGDATELASGTAAMGARAIVAAGGDGTVTQVAMALIDGGPPLLPFPLGNANVFARSLGWPADPMAAARTVERVLGGTLRTRSVTPWRVETDSDETLALMNVGAGLDAAVVAWIEARQGLKQRAGQAGFVAGVVASLPAAGRRQLEIHADHGPGIAAHSLIGALGSPWAWFGARPLDPLPDAAHDGTLHWLAISGSVLGAAQRILRGAVGDRETRGRAEATLEISGTQPFPVQADGEPLPRARRVLVSPASPITVLPAD